MPNVIILNIIMQNGMMLSVIMPNDIMHNVIILNTIMLNIIKLNGIMMDVFMLSAIMLFTIMVPPEMIRMLTNDFRYDPNAYPRPSCDRRRLAEWRWQDGAFSKNVFTGQTVSDFRK
jgi:hypothetical protein